MPPVHVANCRLAPDLVYDMHIVQIGNPQAPHVLLLWLQQTPNLIWVANTGESQDMYVISRRRHSLKSLTPCILDCRFVYSTSACLNLVSVDGSVESTQCWRIGSSC